MAEVLDHPAEREAGFTETPVEPAMPPKKKKNRKKTARRIAAGAVAAAVLGGGIFAWKKLGGGGEAESQVIYDMVQRGSITSMVEGSGAAVAKNSASVTLLSGGQVLEVYVSEGDYVREGDPLYTIESGEAQDRVNDALKTVSNYQKELSALYAAGNDLNVRAEYAGKIVDVQQRLRVGDSVMKDVPLATLVDDTQMLLPLYFSYAYENEIAVGQSASLSIPATMAQLNATVCEIHKVQHISTEGALFFEVVFVVDNPGTLTADMTATATIALGSGETIYPYEPGKLEYFRSTSLTPKVSGKVAGSNLYNDTRVAAGESLVSLTGEDNETEIAAMENQLKAAQKSLEEAQKNLDSLNAFAPIDGTVLAVGIAAGEEAATGTVAVSIADTSTMIVNATIDEMYVSYAKVGMPVDISLWGETQLFGTIESVSLSAQSENGVARFPMVISVDNSEGALMSGAYVQYSFTASQSDDCLLVPIQCVKSAQTMDGEACKVLFVQSDVPPENMAELAMDMMEIPEGFYPVIVETGISDSYNVEILSGVEEFTTVYAGMVQNMNYGGMFF